MVPEAELEETDVGLVPASAGWFVVNARDARWFEKPRQGHSLPLTGDEEYKAWGFYCADETAARYDPSSPEDAQNGTLADARFPAPRAIRYRDALLPD